MSEKAVDKQEVQKMYTLTMPEGILNIVLKLVNETPMARTISDAVLQCIAPQIKQQNIEMNSVAEEPEQVKKKSTRKKK